MTESEYGKLIGRNLKRLAFEKDKTQADIARDLNISKQTISAWMNGKRTPRMKSIDMFCEYFGCKRADIMEEHVSASALEPEVKEKVFLDERILLAYYQSLNQDGKEALLAHAKLLAESKTYTKDTKLSEDSKIS